MKISNNNVRPVGRPSMCALSVRKAVKHHSVNFSSVMAKRFGLSPDIKLSFLCVDSAYYIAFRTDNGYNIKQKKNGTNGTISYTCSSVEIVDTLLSLANAEKYAKFLISAKGMLISGTTYYQIINTPVRVD